MEIIICVIGTMIFWQLDGIREHLKGIKEEMKKSHRG